MEKDAAYILLFAGKGGIDAMSYLLISIKKVLHYRWHVIFSMVGILLTTMAVIFLWKYIYRNDREIQQFMIAYVCLSNMLSLLYSDRYAYYIADKVYKGTFAVDLLRPMHFLKLNCIEVTGEIAANFLIKGVPITVFLFVMYRHILKRISPMYTMLGLLAIILAFLFYMMLHTTLGLLAFWFYEIWPFVRLMNDTIRFFSGSFIPITLFPAWLSVPIMVLPFRYLYYFPIELILQGEQCGNIGWNFAVLIAWDIVIAVSMMIVYKRALFRCVVQGG